MVDTGSQYDNAVAKCRKIFVNKMHDYGLAWRVLRISSLTDQLFIKAQRIKTLEETGNARVNEGVEPEFIGIINYCVMALIQLELGPDDNHDVEKDKILNCYQKYVINAKSLMEAKNHDYGEAWRDMRISSFTDLILMKLLRVKQIEDNQGKTNVSEGIDANYLDILNYAVFALIQLEEVK